MQYESPQLTALSSAINAIEAPTTKPGGQEPDNPPMHEVVGAYEDWE